VTKSAPLVYIGEGRWLPGIPARDLTAEEVETYDRKALLASGLYAPTSKEAAPPAEETEA